MNRIWNAHNWPRPICKTISLIQHVKSLSISIVPFCYEPKFVEYLIYICETYKIQCATLQLALSISSRFSAKNQKYSESTQLILLVSLFIASKILDTQCLSVALLHKVSNHCFTNKDIYRMEERILEGIEFNIFGEGIGDYQVKALLKLVEHLVGANSSDLLAKICEDIQLVIWYAVYTRGEKIPYKLFSLLPAAVVQISLILSTHCSGRFPSTVWTIHILNLQEDQLNNFVQLLLKLMLGKQKMEEFII